MNLEEKKRLGYIRSLARKVIKEYFQNKPPKILPIPIKEIAEFNEFEVFDLDTLNDNQNAIVYFLPDENRKLIGLNRKYHIHNKRFSIGHELGHYFIGHPPESECTEEEIKLYNQEADEFSAELLMPLDVLKEKLKELKDVKKVASQFLVSEQALWIKIKNQNLINLL